MRKTIETNQLYEQISKVRDGSYTELFQKSGFEWDRDTFANVAKYSLESGDENMAFWLFLKAVAEDYFLKFSSVFSEKVFSIHDLTILEHIFVLTKTDFPLIVLLCVFLIYGAYKVSKNGRVPFINSLVFFVLLLGTLSLRFKAEVVLLKKETELLYGPSKVLSTNMVSGNKDVFLVLSNGKLFSKVLTGDFKTYWISKNSKRKI